MEECLGVQFDLTTEYMAVCHDYIHSVPVVRPPGASMPLRARDALADYTEDARRWQVRYCRQ